MFLPLRQYFSVKWAILLTFVVSGFVHDFVNTCIFYNSPGNTQNGTCDGCYTYKLGIMTAFFIFSGVVMLLEKPIRDIAAIQWVSKKVPTFVVATFLVLVHVPLGHWYFGSWIVGGYFSDFAVGLWHIRKL